MKRYLAMGLMSLAAVAAQAKDIVDTAVAAGNFKTLATALQAAGLVDTLKGLGPFTVFAPTDAVFANGVTVGVDSGGRLCVKALATTQALFDVTGWWLE